MERVAEHGRVYILSNVYGGSYASSPFNFVRLSDGSVVELKTTEITHCNIETIVNV